MKKECSSEKKSKIWTNFCSAIGVFPDQIPQHCHSRKSLQKRLRSAAIMRMAEKRRKDSNFCNELSFAAPPRWLQYMGNASIGFRADSPDSLPDPFLQELAGGKSVTRPGVANDGAEVRRERREVCLNQEVGVIAPVALRDAVNGARIWPNVCGIFAREHDND